MAGKYARDCRYAARPESAVQGLNICTGDMGAGKYKMYDIETWMPSRENFGETHSDSNLTDWQARRLNIKYKDKEGKSKYVYTLNNTVIASPRILIAILENYQQRRLRNCAGNFAAVCGQRSY